MYLERHCVEERSLILCLGEGVISLERGTSCIDILWNGVHGFRQLIKPATYNVHDKGTCRKAKQSFVAKKPIKIQRWAKIYSFSFVLLQCLLLALYRIVLPVLILQGQSSNHYQIISWHFRLTNQLNQIVLWGKPSPKKINFLMKKFHYRVLREMQVPTLSIVG